MSEKLRHIDRTQQKIEEDRYESIKTLFTISFVLTDSLMVFDLVANVISRENEQYFYLRFFSTLFGLYGTLILVGGYYLIEYCDCEFSCSCCKFCEKFFSYCGCHVLVGGLLLIISYCVELCSIKFYFGNKDSINESLVVFLMYLLFIFSSLTILSFVLLIINQKNEKKLKEKID